MRCCCSSTSTTVSPPAGCRRLTANGAGPDQIRDRLAQLGRLTRIALADIKGWRVVEPLDEPTAITTLAPVDADPQRVRAWLIAERRIVTTYAKVQRAPFEMTSRCCGRRRTSIPLPRTSSIRRGAGRCDAGDF